MSKLCKILILVISSAFAPSAFSEEDKNMMHSEMSSGNYRIAIIDLESILRQHKEVKKFRDELGKESKELQADSETRLQEVRQAREEVEKLRKQSEDSSVSFARRSELQKEINQKVRAGIALEKEHRSYLARRNQAINARVVRKMKSIVSAVKDVIISYAKENDYDFVFDRTARSGSETSVVLYSKDSFDITKDIIKILP